MYVVLIFHAKSDTGVDFFCAAQLYKAIYQYVLSKPHIAELTVEDPAEAFEDLRDKNDLEMLQNHKQFTEEANGSSGPAGGRVGGVGLGKRSGRGGAKQTKGKLGPPVDKTWAEKWRKDLKIAGVSRFDDTAGVLAR